MAPKTEQSPEPVALEDLTTVRKLSVELARLDLPFASEAALRWHIANAARNGLKAAIVRRGHRVFIHKPRFLRWATTGEAVARG